uniref:Uncharacterized protein n=1 Tax=Anguilla anguilla TaxID=7936 RepID=A0A0E9S4W3_ANGAN
MTVKNFSHNTTFLHVVLLGGENPALGIWCL